METTLLIIATICLVILTLALIAVFVTIYRILSDLRDVLKIIKHESAFVAADIHELRQKIRDRAATVNKVAGLLAASRSAASLLRLVSRTRSRKRIGNILDQ